MEHRALFKEAWGAFARISGLKRYHDSLFVDHGALVTKDTALYSIKRNPHEQVPLSLSITHGPIFTSAPGDRTYSPIFGGKK